ncbi:MAG: hypothetical protein IJI68_04850 [Eggerthellaceae bacterium]|nr:hypothetical protein [Eggerthellaceae bacterium]
MENTEQNETVEPDGLPELNDLDERIATPDVLDEQLATSDDLDERLAALDDLDERLAALEDAERAIDDAYTTGKAERAKITQMAQLDAAEAVAMAGIAMEADIEADEAMRIAVIAEKSGNRERAKTARKKEREARKKANAEHAAATKSAKQAYDAIKFSAPNKMGFMRVVQIAFAVHIGIVLVYLMMTSRDHMVYNVSSIMDWIMVILEGVAFWMFINRYKIARPFVIAMAAFGLIVPAAYDIITGQFSLFALLFNGAFYIFLIFYFALSSRVKATLVNDFSQHKGDYEKDDLIIDRHGWPFYRNLIMYFILFSVIGHWMEMGMCQFIILGLVQGEYDPSNTLLWRDVLYPFPMEGAAVVIIALVLYPFYLWLKKHIKPRALVYIISFLSGALLCTLIEFSMGMIVNADLQLWDYRDNFCNFMGQVCLQNTMAFGVVASVITWWVYPLMERMIARVPRDKMNIVFVIVAIFGAIIWSLYIINPPGVDEQNKHPELAPRIEQEQQAAERELGRKRLVTSFDGVDTLNDMARDEAKESTDITDAEKKKILEEIDEISASLKAIAEELAEDELPIEELVEETAASSSAAAAATS